MSADAAMLVFTVGCLTGAVGIGSSLALPVLFALGMPASVALLAFKLPIAVADLGATGGFAYHGGLPRSGLRGQLLLAAAAGGLGSAFMLGKFGPLMAVSLGLVWAICVVSRAPRPSAMIAAVATYIGACGWGAGLMLALAGRRYFGDSLRCSLGRARAIGAAANLSAVALIVLCVDVPWREVLGLTIALTAGSLVGASISARTGGSSRRPAMQASRYDYGAGT